MFATAEISREHLGGRFQESTTPEVVTRLKIYGRCEDRNATKEMDRLRQQIRSRAGSKAGKTITRLRY